MKRFILFLLLGMCRFMSFSQDSEEQVSSRYMYSTNRYDSINSSNYEKNHKKSKAFYDSLQQRASQKRWTRELHDIIINNTTEKDSKNHYKKQQSVTPYLPYKDKYIRNIRINKIDVFGPEVYDTTLSAGSWFERWANKIHIKTIDNILNNNIIVREGEKIDPYKIADNERLLRELPYVNDARIYVLNSSGKTDSVDLLFVIKDVWSKGFGVQFKRLDAGRIEIWDRNIFGTGHENQNNIIYDTDKKPLFGYEGIYRVRNISGSFINGEIGYISAHDIRSYHLNINRRFFTPSTQYAGGLLLRNHESVESFNDIDSINPTPVHYNHYNIWLGKSFPVTVSNLLFTGRSNITLAGAINNYKFDKAPKTTNDFLYPYQSRTLFLGSVSFSSQSYYKTNFIYNFGRTEDIPTGMLIKLTVGPEYNQYGKRWYSSLSVARGVYYRNFGYLYTGSDIGFFVNDKRDIEQGIVRLKLNYFTNLHRVGNLRFRQFMRLNYTTGFNRNIDEYITINNKEGIRGFNSSLIRNTKKLILNTESVLFTPLFVYGFRFVFYGFGDIGFIGPNNKNIFSNRLYSGIGLGIRVRNEKLVFRTFQLQLAYYPHSPVDTDNYLLQVSGEPRLRPDDFFITSPNIIDFK